MNHSRIPTTSPSLWQDTHERFGRVSRYLHWLMAALFVWQFAGMIAKVTLGRDANLTQMIAGTHADIGVLLLILMIIRGAWGLTQIGQRPTHGEGFWGVAAWLGHAGLYVLMLVVPALATLRMLGNNRAFEWFGLIPLNDGQGDKVAWMMEPGNAAHGLLGWVLLAVIVGHVFMVLIHRFVWKDDVAQRMIGRVK